MKLPFTKRTALIQEDRVNLMTMFNCAGVQSEFMWTSLKGILMLMNIGDAQFLQLRPFLVKQAVAHKWLMNQEQNASAE